MKKILIAITSLIIISCGKDLPSSGPGELVSERGYPYVMHGVASDNKADVGDEVYFHIEVMVRDTVLYDSRNTRQTQRFKILEDSEITDKTNPLLDAFSLMGIGDSLILYFPSDSLPPLPAGFEDEKYVAYHIALKEIVKDSDMVDPAKEEEIAALVQKDIASYKNGILTDLMDLGDDFKILIHKQGAGPIARKGQYVKVHYYGALIEDGTMFDNSFGRGAPFVFAVNMQEVIQGWDMAFGVLNQGTKATLFIPSKFGYGKKGNGPIKANSDLVFYIEI